MWESFGLGKPGGGRLGLERCLECLDHVARRATALLAGSGLFGGAKRVRDDRAQRAGAASAIRAAAETLVDLRRGARAARPRIEAVAHIAIGEDVTGADDHCFRRRSLSQAITPRWILSGSHTTWGEPLQHSNPYIGLL